METPTAPDEAGDTADAHQLVTDAVQQGDLAALSLIAVLIQQQVTGGVCKAIDRYRDLQQRSLAHIAIQLNNLEVLDFVLASGLDPDLSCKDSDGHSPMSVAVLARNVNAVRVLLSFGTSVRQCDGDLHTLLHLLAMNSVENVEDGAAVVDVLVRSGEVDVNGRDGSGNTPLHLAAVYGSPAIANRLLTQAGANVNAVNEGGSTPLHFATATGDYEIARALIDAGADVNTTNLLGNTPLIDAAFVSQSSPPHFAFGDQHTQSKVVKLLLENGADTNAINHDGNNALFGAVRNEFEDVICQLSRQQQESSRGFQQRNNRGETLLHVAARAQVTNVSIWETLLRLCEVESVNTLDQFERSCVGIWMAWPQRTGGDLDEHDSVGGSTSSPDASESVDSGTQAVAKLLLSMTSCS